MPDAATQFNSLYNNYFERLFDDVFSIDEERIVPMSEVAENLSVEDRKKMRTAMVNEKKKLLIREAHEELDRIKVDNVTSSELSLAKEVFDVTGTEEECAKKRLARALRPLDIKIPSIKKNMYMSQWGLGGPSRHQRKLVAYLLKLPRENAEKWFLDMLALYLAFREGLRVGPQTLEELRQLMRNRFFDKDEEKNVISLFYPDGDEDDIENIENAVQLGELNIGKVFLNLTFLTDRNEAFKAFVKKCFTLAPEFRQKLASRLLFKRLADLNEKFYFSKQLKYNFLRITWERKFNYMDDYIVCLIMFIHDKTGNIKWEEAEDLLFNESREIIMKEFQLAKGDTNRFTFNFKTV